MSTDLEQELRDALHARAAAVTPARLRRSVPARRRPRVAGWLLAAAAVAALIAGLSVAVVNGRGGHHPATGGPAALVNTRWRVTAVTEHGHRVAITSREVFVEFGRAGAFHANDGVNYYSGRWRAAAGGVRITDVAGTLAGYAGSDPAVLAAQKGIGALTAGAGVVGARRSGTTLRLTAGGLTVDLVRAGVPATGGAGSAPSATATATGN